MDEAVSTLLTDLEDRGLLETTLVVMVGEFGRSPRVNRKSGREHWPQVQSILRSTSIPTGEGMLGRQIAETLELSRSYRGYIWSEWLTGTIPELLTLLAVVLGSGGLLSQAGRGGALFTLSLPVSRRRLVAVRAATGLGEVLLLAIVPVLLLPLLSPAVGETYGIGDAAVHALCLVIGSSVLFALRVPVVDGVQRRVASRTDRHLPGRARRIDRADLWLLPLRCLRPDERRALFPRRRFSVDKCVGQRRGDDRRAIGRRRQHRASGLLIRTGELTCLYPFSR